MKRSIPISSLVACLCLSVTAQPLLAQPAATGTIKKAIPAESVSPTTNSTAGCLSNIHDLNVRMERDGYWPGGTGYGYDNPMGAYPAGVAGYRSARPGHEIRILLAAAGIFARYGQEQRCLDTLSSSRDIYARYVTVMKDGGTPKVDWPSRGQQQISDAVPVASLNASFRSDELLGAEVRTPKNEALGSVDDLIVSPKTGKIAYLVIASGGFLGIDEKFVPVPWEDFKVTPNFSVLVLDSSTKAIAAAPHVKKDRFSSSENFDQEAQTVNTYWKDKALITGSK